MNWNYIVLTLIAAQFLAFCLASKRVMRRCWASAELAKEERIKAEKQHCTPKNSGPTRKLREYLIYTKKTDQPMRGLAHNSYVSNGILWVVTEDGGLESDVFGVPWREVLWVEVANAG